MTVTPQVAGRITERQFEDGAELKKDQLLFTIDPRPFQAQLDSAQAQLAQSKAALDLAQYAAENVRLASPIPAPSRSSISKPRKNTVAVDEAQVQAAAGGGRKREAQSRVLLHPFADRRPRRRAPGGRRQRGAGQHHGIAV